MRSAKEACDVIRDAATTANETADYLSYATVLELNCGDATQFTLPDALLVLQTLGQVLAANPKIVYSIGWDIPALLLAYLDQFWRWEYSDDGSDSKLMTAVNEIANILCRYGNHKELFLKSCEILEDVSSGADSYSNGEEVDDDDTPGPDNVQDVDPENKKAQDVKSENKTPQDVDPINSQDVDPKGALDVDPDVVAEKHEFSGNVWLSVLFEIMNYSMGQVKTAYPTRFLATAMSNLLAFASTRVTRLSVATVLRRMYLLARDFDMDVSLASASEHAKVRRMLRYFPTHALNISAQHVNVKWAQRLYYELVNRAAVDHPSRRDQCFRVTGYTQRLDDVFNRFAQLALSYDLDPEADIRQATDLYFSGPGETSDESTEDEDLASDQRGTERLLTPSHAGSYLLMTQLRFRGRRRRTEIKNAMATAVFIYQNYALTCGLKDAILYWALWSSTGVTSEAVHELDHEHFCTYLQIILAIAETARYKIERHIAFSVVAKLLRLQDPTVSYDFIIDTLESCPYGAVRDAAVQILKTLVTGKTRCAPPVQNVDSLVQRVSDLSLSAPITLTPERRKQLAGIADNVTTSLGFDEAVELPYVLSWLNFLTVVPTDPEIVNRIVGRVEKYAKDDDSKESTMLALAAESLKTSVAHQNNNK